jgi:CRP-like cAMP-binding protein
MFNKLFGRQPAVNVAASERESELLDFVDTETRTMVAEMLTAPAAFMQLSLEEARFVVGYMTAHFIPKGTVFIREGDESQTDFLVLVLDGDVTVESIVVSRISPITLSVLGPGSMHGELGLIDGMPRSASCTASTDLSCAILTRASMLKLIDDDPRTGLKLMMAIAMRIGDRLRDNTEKLKKFVQLTRTMQQEINHIRPH